MVEGENCLLLLFAIMFTLDLMLMRCVYHIFQHLGQVKTLTSLFSLTFFICGMPILFQHQDPNVVSYSIFVAGDAFMFFSDLRQDVLL